MPQRSFHFQGRHLCEGDAEIWLADPHFSGITPDIEPAARGFLRAIRDYCVREKDFFVGSRGF